MTDYRSNTVKAADVQDLPADPRFKDLPEALKDPMMFMVVEKKLQYIMFSDHKHRKMETFINCKRCKAKVTKRHNALLEFGFTDYNQYLHWKRIMNFIIKNNLNDNKDKKAA